MVGFALLVPGRPHPTRLYRLEKEDGTPVDPPLPHTAVPTWHAGDTISLGAGRTLRVMEVRPGSHVGDNPVLVVRPA